MSSSALSPPATSGIVDGDAWIDVTSLLKEAASQLTNKNPMISDVYFSLHDSMSATEIMDPKTDQCCGIDGSKELKELLRPNFPDDYTYADAASLLATMLSNEVAFIDGASILESTHNCLFSWDESWKFLLDSDSSLNSSSSGGERNEGHMAVIKRVIYIYSLSQQRCIDYIYKSITDADVFEDEDFHPCSMSINISREIDDAFIIDKLNQSMRELSDSQQGSDVARLANLLKLRAEFHSFCISMHDAITYQPRGGASSLTDPSEIRKFRAAALEKIDILNVRIVSLKGALSETLAVCASDNDEIIISNPRNAFACEGTVAVRLVLTTPKRAINFKSLKESLKHLTVICEELVDVGMWVLSTAAAISSSNRENYRSGDVTIDTFVNYSMAFSAKKPHLLSRSAFLSFMRALYHDLPRTIILSWSMRLIPGKLVAMEHETINVRYKFAEQLQALFWDTFKLFATHRNRLLVKLDRLLPYYGSVIEDASYLDNMYIRIINGVSLDSDVATDAADFVIQEQWLYYYLTGFCAKLIDVRMGLMIEYALISLKEMDFFYWYWDFICSITLYSSDILKKYKLEEYERLLRTEITHQRDNQLKALKDSNKYNTKTFKQLNSAENESRLFASAVTKLNDRRISNPRDQREDDALYVEAEFVRGKGQMCKAIFRIFSYYAKVGVIDKTENKFSSWECLYNMRFEIFRCLGGVSYLYYIDFLTTLHLEKDASKIEAKGDDRHVSSLSPSSLLEYLSKHLDASSTVYQNLKKNRPNVSSKSVVAYQFPYQRTDHYFVDAIMPFSKVIVSNKILCTKLQADLANNKDQTPIGTLSLDYKFSPHFPVVSFK